LLLSKETLFNFQASKVVQKKFAIFLLKKEFSLCFKYHFGCNHDKSLGNLVQNVAQRDSSTNINREKIINPFNHYSLFRLFIG